MLNLRLVRGPEPVALYSTGYDRRFSVSSNVVLWRSELVCHELPQPAQSRRTK